MTNTEDRYINIVLNTDTVNVVSFTRTVEAITAAFADFREATYATAAWERYESGPFAKLCRRAKGAKWERTATDADTVITVDGYAVAALFTPRSRPETSPLLSRLQLQHFPTYELAAFDPTVPVPTIVVNAEVSMSPPKALVAATHVAHLAALEGTPLVTPRVQRGRVVPEMRCQIADAGRTEVAPGSVTAALWVPQQ